MVLLMLGAQLAGCAASTPISTYVLNVHAEPAASSTSIAGNQILLVATPTAEPGYDTSLIAYSQRPFALNYYTKNRWVDTPARMLHPLLVDSLSGSQAFAAVVGLPTPVEGDLRLETSIIRLLQDFTQQPSQVEVVLQAKLIDTTTGRLLGSRSFEAVEPAVSEDAYGGVQAANRALGRILQELQDFVLEAAVKPQQGLRTTF